MTGIYSILSPSGKMYIGQSIDLISRKSCYVTGKTTKQPLIHKSILKYGWNQHTFTVIHSLPEDVSIEVLNTYEQFYIEIYKAAGISLLNLTEGGKNAIPTEAVRAKISATLKGRTVSPETLKKMKGRKLSISHKKNIAKAITGRKFSAETKKKISDKRKGAKFSAQHLANLSASQKKRWKS